MSDRNKILLTFSLVSQSLLLVSKSPRLLKTLSAVVLVAITAKYFLAIQSGRESCRFSSPNSANNSESSSLPSPLLVLELAMMQRHN